MMCRDTHGHHYAAHFAFRQRIDNSREPSLEKRLLAWVCPFDSRHDVHLPAFLPYCNSVFRGLLLSVLSRQVTTSSKGCPQRGPVKPFQNVTEASNVEPFEM